MPRIQPSDAPACANSPATVPEGRRIYAIGDIHGRADLLGDLLSLIENDAQISDRGLRRPCLSVIILLGDYIDRGPDSSGVIERLIALEKNGLGTNRIKAVFLKGNHEVLLTDYASSSMHHRVWQSNGGDATIASYGLDPQLVTPQILRAAIQGDHHASNHRDFLSRLKDYHVEGDYLFVHAGIRPGVALGAQRAADLFWIRKPFLTHKDPFDYFVVHGHSIQTEPDVRSNRIGIDTGAYYTGRLTAVVLEGTSHRFIFAQGPPEAHNDPERDGYKAL